MYHDFPLNLMEMHYFPFRWSNKYYSELWVGTVLSVKGKR